MINLIYGFVSRINRCFTKLYSYTISLRLNKKSSNIYVEYPIYLRGESNITVGSNFTTHKRLRLETYSSFQGVDFSPTISIGNNVCINYDCHIGAINKIVIGNNVLIASRVFITDHFHGQVQTLEEMNIPPSQRPLYSKGPVIIGDNVWIGENVSILPNVRIGSGAVIGANSVVSKDIPDYAIACGVPAKIIKQL